MSLLERLRGEPNMETQPQRSLAREASAMRAALTGLHAERAETLGEYGEPDLRAMVRDLLEGEIAAPTGDVRSLIGERADPDEFYDREIKPNWDGLDEESRADKLDGFLELAQMVEDSPGALPAEMVAPLRTKLLVLAWAFDEVHGYLGTMAAG